MSRKKDELDALIFEPFEKLEFTHPQTGEVYKGLELVEFAYTREGRRVFGQELPNPQPIDPPIGFVPEEPIADQIRRQVLRALAARDEEEEFEDEEEADDFDVGDDYDPSSPWEEHFEPEGPWPPRPDGAAAPEAPPASPPVAGSPEGAGEPSTPAATPPAAGST